MNSETNDPTTFREHTSGHPAPDLSAPPILSAPPDGKALRRVPRRRWRLAVGLGLLIGLIAATAAYFTPNMDSFTATTTLRVDAQQERILFQSNATPISFDTYQRSQVAFIKSRTVLNGTLREPKVAQLNIVREQADPVDWLEKQLQLDFAPSPEILRISISGKEPDELLTIVGTVRDVYLREIVNSERTLRAERLKQVTDLYKEYADKLKSQRKVLADLADDVGSREPTVLLSRQELQLKLLNACQMELVNLQKSILEAQVELRVKEGKVKALDNMPIPEEDIEEFTNKDDLVRNKQKEIEQLEKKLAIWGNSSPSSGKEPGHVEDLRLLEAARKALAARREELKATATDQLRQQLRRKLLHELADRQSSLTALELLQTEWRKMLDDRANGVRVVGKKSNSLDGLRNEIEIADAIAKRAGNEAEARRVELEAPSRVRKMDDPYVVKRPGPWIQASIAGVVGFCTVILLYLVCLLVLPTRQ